MNMTKYELLFSQLRFSRYLNSCNGNAENAISLYKYNIQASQALYPLISVFEVTLRNGIDRVLIKHFRDNNWLLTKRHEFAYHPNMVFKNSRGNIVSDDFFAVRLKKTEARLTHLGIPISHGKLLAELTFGFGNICLSTIDSYETNVLEALGWLDADLKHWSNKINFFRPVYNRIAEIVNSKFASSFN